MSIVKELKTQFVIAYAKLIIGSHKNRVRPDQGSVSRYFNSTAGRYVFARMMLLSYYNAQPHKYTITRVADTLDMSRQATSYMIRECLDAEYIHKCTRRGYVASDELIEAFMEFMPLHESVVHETGIIGVMQALDTARTLENNRDWHVNLDS